MITIYIFLLPISVDVVKPFEESKAYYNNLGINKLEFVILCRITNRVRILLQKSSLRRNVLGVFQPSITTKVNKKGKEENTGE